jgi:glycosyltransferase involved in cell wall biosynthesis
LRFLYFWKKSFVTFHGYEGIVPPRKNAILIRKISYELARKSILVGSFIKKWYGTPSPFITYGGVERKKIFKYKYKRKELRILIIGRLDRDIGVHTYIEVLKHLDELGVKYSCTVLGDGLMRTSIEKYATVKGFVNDVSYMADQSDIIFASSYLSILEGLIRKKLVVAVYENQLKKDYLRPVSRYILMSNDGSTLALEIQKYLRHKKLFKNMIEVGHVWASAQTWQKVADLYEEVWKK